MSGAATPEHKALVATVTKWLDGGCNSWGLPSGEIRKLCAAIESLSAQCAQPQAGEPIGYLVQGFDGGPFYATDREQYDRQGHAVVPVYASPQPANPAQVPDAVTNAARNLHASLDPENDLKTPEQFNAWSALDLALTSALASNKPVGDGYVPAAQECATEGCGKPATVHFIRGGIGSYYCYDCYMRVQARAALASVKGD